jgi:hypothetical protein
MLSVECLLLAQSGHERPKFAAVQTNPESHSGRWPHPRSAGLAEILLVAHHSIFG